MRDRSRRDLAIGNTLGLADIPEEILCTGRFEATAEQRCGLVVSMWFCSYLSGTHLIAAAPDVVTISRHPTAEELAKESGVSGGLVVHVGCGEGSLTADLRANDRIVLFGLDREPRIVASARQHAHERGMADAVLIDTFDGVQMPCIDCLVNLFVIQDGADITADEVSRVLRPLGVALIRDGGKWRKAV